MTILIKNSSSWDHQNWPKNLHNDVVEWIKEQYVENGLINKLNVINPEYMEFEEQLKLISTSSIILCQWGGISMSNFLAPLNAVEIIITMWDEINDYTKKSHKDVIPDYEMTVRNTITTQTTLRYWDKSDKSRIEHIGL